MKDKVFNFFTTHCTVYLTIELFKLPKNGINIVHSLRS